jgi:hypothetical protein
MHILLKFKHVYLIRIYSVLSRFKRRLFIPRDINGPLLAIKSLILYIDNKINCKTSYLAF